MGIHVNTGVQTYGTDMDMHIHVRVHADTHGCTSTGTYMQIPRCGDYRTRTPTSVHSMWWESVLLAGTRTGLMTVSHVFVHRYSLSTVVTEANIHSYPEGMHSSPVHI